MPPITASSRFSLATSRLVKSKRFITLMLSRRLAPARGAVMAGSVLQHLAAGQQRRQDERGRSLGADRLLDRAVDDELQLVETGDGVVLDADGVQHRPHGTAD